MSNQDFYDLAFPVDYWDRLDRARLTPDDHSMFGEPETFDWAIQLSKPTTIVEVGSWKGHSANYMADRCRSLGLTPRIVCIDTFLGAVEHWILPGEIRNLHLENGRPTILERFQANTLARENQDMVLPFPIDSSNGASVLRHLGFTADLIFIDAAHDYTAVARDIMDFWAILSDGGLMFGDDYNYDPVRFAVHDVAIRLGMRVVVGGRKWFYFKTVPEVLPAGFSLRVQ